ncbi:Nitronate monooxygenase like protein [Verticillium longisporum]|nr:Nitronate monooxygenase like protein [Verticillium longisporum]
MAPSKLFPWFPHARSPIIINAPMMITANAALATEVTKAGGIGFIGAGFDLSAASAETGQLKDLANGLTEARVRLNLPPTAPLPLGVGFITAHETASQFAAHALPILTRHRVAAAWLFAPHPETKPHSAIIAALHEAEIRVFVQGVDAGGHQFERGCGVVALLPEVRALLANEFPDRHVAVVAAGGIVEASGVAAAVALGAEGVVMGTRFIATPEAGFADEYKALVVKTTDGGVSTWKTPFHDRLAANGLWKPGFDGRAIVGDIHREHMKGGVTVEESRERLKTGWSEEEAKFMVGKWAGTGVGLVKDLKPASEVVTEAREGARRIIRELAEGL